MCGRKKGIENRGSSQQRDHFHLIIFCIVALLFTIGCSEEQIQGPPPASGPDTTSHDFVWEPMIVTDRDAHGVLHDICYINDTCIWAVGWIGVGSEYVNAYHWNGKEWLFEKVLDSIRVHELTAVYGSAPNDIWFVSGNLFTHWDGSKFRTDFSIWQQMKGVVSECWGSGPDNIWMGGENGSLVHFDGTRWKVIPNEIQNDWDICGMHGNGDTLVLAATQYGAAGETAFYHIIGESVDFWRQDSRPVAVHAVWYDHLSDIFTDGGEAYLWNGESWINLHAPYQSGFAIDMAANNRFDILICGQQSSIRHYNGMTWRNWWKFPGIESAFLLSIAMHENEVWIAGSAIEGGRPLLIHGKRLP